MENILPYGSCRIFDPLKVMRREKQINMHLKDAYWYTHSTGEVLQRHRILTRDITIPDHLVPFVFEERDPNARPYAAENYSPSFLDNVTFMVVEITTMKMYKCGDVRLQMYLLQKEAARLGLEWQYVRRFMRAPIERRHELPEFSSNYGKLAASFEMFTEEQQSPQELIADLDAIQNLLSRPFLLVGHFNIPNNEGKLLPDRALLNQTLASWAESQSRSFFDPSVFYQWHGMHGVFSDISHYEKDFLPQVSEVLRPLLRRRAHAVACPLKSGPPLM